MRIPHQDQIFTRGMNFATEDRAFKQQTIGINKTIVKAKEITEKTSEIGMECLRLDTFHGNQITQSIFKPINGITMLN